MLNHSNHSNALGELSCGSVTEISPASLYPDKRLTAAAAFLSDAQHIREMAIAIGNTSDTVAAAGITDALAANFNAAFYNRTSGAYGTGFQTEQLLPLLLGLAPDSTAATAVLASLVSDIAVTHRNHTTTGIVGLRALFEVLPALGYADVALATLLRTDYPSFGYSLSNDVEPATSIWEVFDAPFEGGSMDSRNHVMYATPSYFLFSAVAGIKPVQGDRLWSVAPAVVGASGELTSASAAVATVRGELSTSWLLVSTAPWKVDLNVTVPVGLRAEITIPGNPREPKEGNAQCDVTSWDPSVTRLVTIWSGRGRSKGVSSLGSGVLAVEAGIGRANHAVAAMITLDSGVYQLSAHCGPEIKL